MRKKRFWIIRAIDTVLVLLSTVLLCLLFFTDRTAFLIALPFSAVIIGIAIYHIFKIQDDLNKIIVGMSKTLSDSNDARLITFPIPSVILGNTGEIIWYNNSFKTNVLSSTGDVFGNNIKTVVGKEVLELSAGQGITVECCSKYYKCYCTATKNHGQDVYLVYLVDISELEKTRITYEKTRLVVMLPVIDNYDDSIGNTNEGNSARLIGDVQRVLQQTADEANGFIKKLSHDRYIIMIEQQSLDKFIAGRFSVLDKIREIETENGVPITLSIGVAPVETSLLSAEQNARQALDMALGRGGDQAALKTASGYEFFGGFSKGVEKRTKVKTRMVASAMAELISAADNVLVMGHRFSDLDCIGSAVGIAKACESFGKPVNVVLDVYKSLAGDLIERLCAAGKQQLFLHPDMALEQITPKTLLIVVDTHGQNLLESQAVYKKCKQVVVIDHHRKLVNHIDNAVIFYHEPYASSASEMVTELIQYFGEQIKINAVEAEALLAGITLDTRNFVLRTGVRTFEAAAYLRRMGVDTVSVRELFASSMGDYQERTQVVSSAEIYNECAIAVCDENIANLRIIAPQAADELLNISGVRASFVLYEKDDVVYISARSMGAYNMQIMMEELGGGGHHTMAAAQIPDSSISKVKQSLLEIIDKYTKYTAKED